MEDKMKRILTVAALCLSSGAAYAGNQLQAESPIYGGSFFAGFTWSFGAGPGATIKYISTNDPNQVGIAGGLTYYFNGDIGCDLGAAINGTGTSLVLSYDFCTRGMQGSLGVTQDHGTTLPLIGG